MPVDGDSGTTIREQREFYDARAAEYDDAYERTAKYDRGAANNAEWHAEMAQLVRAFDALSWAGDVVELAAGTGFWTERLVRRAQSLTVIDGSAAMLAINRKRLGAASERAHYEVADLLAWRPARSWDVCVFAFWLCHVPDDRVATFLRTVAESLRASGVVCIVEKAVATDPETEREVRTLNDGRQFTIIEHPRPPATLIDTCAAAGLNVTVETIGTRFCLGHGTRA
jgi:ubiquinone/menaquinone biosynthesis C-methylase UbiE